MEQVGRYQITGELGRGAMGVVYRALDPAIGRTAAIKTIHLTDLSDPGERERVAERLRREAQAAGTLSHPNIVTVYDVLETPEFAYIVMEYVPGSSLEAMLRERQVPEREELLSFLRQVAGALDYAHRKGIIHRDVKPANILISEGAGGTERVAKITDFGVAREISHDVTQSGSLTGTPSYMSPEQIQGLKVDGRSDQYSLAVVVYELLSGEKPFAADSLPALLHLICTAGAPAIEQRNPALGETVGKVMQRALAKDPADRFASAGDFVGALSIALAESSARSGSATAIAAPRAERSGGQLSGAENSVAPSPAHSDTGQSAAPALRRGPPLKKLALIVFLCFAVATVLMFIVRMNAVEQIPVQVVDPEAGPASPPSAADAGGKATAPGKRAQSPPPATIGKPRSSSATPAPAPVERTRPAGGEGIADVELLTEPAGARITVDGRADAVCTAPCAMSLPAGRHTLTAELNGYSLARRIFSIPEATSLYIALAQNTGVLFVTSVPSGAAVTVDGSAYGRTPVTLRLAPGLHRIGVAYGSATRQDTVNIEPGSFQTRSIRW